MKRKKAFMHLAALVVLWGFSCRPISAQIRIENKHFLYEADSKGRNLRFVDKKTSRDYLRKDSTSFFAYLKRGAKVYQPSSVRQRQNQFEVRFDGIRSVGFISLRFDDDRAILKVDSLIGEADSFTFLNIPLTLDAVPDEPFAVCALSLNLQTHVRQLPALQTHLWAAGYDKFGLINAEVAIVAVPMDAILSTIRKVMKADSDLPFSDKGGAWAQLNKEGCGSYLMDFGTLTLDTVDDWIAKCDSLGFNQIAIHGANSFFKNGDMELFENKWPGGWADFKKINARLHEAGISSILLTYAYFIDKSSKYVTPVPSPDLGFFNAFTLDKPLGPDDDEIYVRESTADVSAIVGYFVQNSNTLRIGEELVEFSGVTKSPPFKFTGVKRGVNGTTVSAHAAGEKGYHLQQMFGQFVPGPETKLFDEIARKTAVILNENDFDGLYLDAIDGNKMLGGKESAWYYGSKFVLEIARHLNPMVGMEMCDMPHHYWHYSSRWQAWDKAVRGYKRFVDVHLAALKSDDHRHGEWIGYTKTINRLAPQKNGRLMLPLHMGWWGNNTWDSPQVETTFPDDMEYLLTKMIGNDAGLSMLGGTDEATLHAKPIFRRLVALTRQYEKLRHAGYFSESVKDRLRQPGKEFTLEESGGKWNFREIAYDKAIVEGPDSELTVRNAFNRQPLMLRIQAQMSVGSFSSEGNIALADFKSENEFKLDTIAQGVESHVSVRKESGEKGNIATFTARSDGASAREATWVKWEKKFEPCLDLSKHQGLGVWVNGDGSGALLNFRTESPKHLSMGARGDHFIRLDFVGWRYFELVEIESAAFHNYLWPDEFHNVYNSYFYKVVFNCVDKLQIWINKVPPGKEVKVEIGEVKAMPLHAQSIEDLVVQIGERTLTFPVKMKPGMYLEFFNPDDCKLYTAEGALLQHLKPEGIVPVLDTGKNKLRLNVRTIDGLRPRVGVTVISKGALLENLDSTDKCN